MLQKQNWMKYARAMMTEWKQCMEEGKNVEEFREICEAVVNLSLREDCERIAKEIGTVMNQRETRENYPYLEPSRYEEIQASLNRTETPREGTELSEQEKRDRIRGAWIGRISGCLLGKPMEGLMRDTIETILKRTGNYPMERYVDSREFPEGMEEEVNMESFLPWQKCWADTIKGKAPVDDDTNYTVFALKLVEEYGKDFTPDDVLEAWLRWFPMFAECTAERRAYRNAAAGLYAPETALCQNPYREWIGAQIRGDFFGYIHPGEPKKAAEMAWRDASISHVKNGIYGEMFAAAMIAEAFVENDIRRILEKGLSEIPPTSRLYEQVQKVMKWEQEGMSEQEVIDRIHQEYDEHQEHDWCHTNSNAMVVAAALLYGKGDFGKTICLAVQAGFDTDCNGATVGSVVGILNGAAQIPEYWTSYYHEKLLTSLMGYQEVTVEELTEKTLRLMES